jgi:nitrogen fixation NifU-like protein
MYQEVILNHNKNPIGQGKLPSATHQGEAFNPICGDQIAVELQISGEIVRSAGFTAKCCALCRASASVMIGLISGKSLLELREMKVSFDQMISGQGEVMNGDAAAFVAMVKYPARIKCVSLPWKALEEAKK